MNEIVDITIEGKDKFHPWDMEIPLEAAAPELQGNIDQMKPNGRIDTPEVNGSM